MTTRLSLSAGTLLALSAYTPLAAQDCSDVLRAGDQTLLDRYGVAVSIAGDWALVGAPGDADKGAATGSAYFLERIGDRWVESSKVVAAGGERRHSFGASVALAGDVALIGAPGDGDHLSGGRVYVFERAGDDWIETQQLAPTGGQVGAAFGSALALDSDWAIIGTPGDDRLAPDAGSVVVFRRAGSSWLPHSTVVAFDGSAGARFGSAVGVSGANLIVGSPHAPGAPDASGAPPDVGAAYVYAWDGVKWARRARLSSAAGEAGDAFGAAVAIAENAALAGVPGEDGGGLDEGAVHVFELDAAGWELAQVLKSPAHLPGAFGSSIALDVGRALVGEPHSGLGRAYVFDRESTSWELTDELLPDQCDCNPFSFGASVALDGNLACVGSPDEGLAGATTGGAAAYVFERRSNVWLKRERVVASDMMDYAEVGSAVAMAGERVLLGAPRDSFVGEVGSAYVFEREGGEWHEAQRLPLEPLAATDSFGWSAALGGDLAVVGDNDSLGGQFSVGSVHVFEHGSDGWEEIQVLRASDAAPSSWFSRALALHEGTLFVGAPLAGATYVFERTGSTWDETQVLTPSDGAAGLGSSVALQARRAVVGSRFAGQAGLNSGAAYVFENTGTGWNETDKLLASDAQAGDDFAGSVALRDGLIAVGAPGDDDIGSVYLFARRGSTWLELQKLRGSDSTSGDDFGAAVAIAERRIVVGAPRHDFEGAVYVFEARGGVWGEVASLRGEGGFALLGSALAADGDRVVAGAPSDEGHGITAGAAYVIDLPCLAP